MEKRVDRIWNRGFEIIISHVLKTAIKLFLLFILLPAFAFANEALVAALECKSKKDEDKQFVFLYKHGVAENYTAVCKSEIETSAKKFVTCYGDIREDAKYITGCANSIGLGCSRALHISRESLDTYFAVTRCAADTL